MAQVLQWQHAPDAQHAAIEACAAALLRGELVILPTESVYAVVANAAHPDAVNQLMTWRGTDALSPALALRGRGEVVDWVPSLSPLGRRLARRCWPGPVILTVAHGDDSALARRLPDAVRQAVCPEGTVGLTAPYHAAVGQLLDHLPVPVVLGELAADDEQPVTTSAAVPQSVREAVAVVVDDGPTFFGRPPTVVELRGDEWKVRREGAVTAEEIALFAARLVLFICTGNTCRSPLAEVLCKKLLAERLGCAVEELPRQGYLVMSAGVAALRGEPAPADAVAVGQDLGADLTGHSSRPVTPELLEQADVIVGMTAGHLQSLTAYADDLTAQVRLLGGPAGDLADPVGGDRAVYEACAGAIWQHMQGLVADLLA